MQLNKVESLPSLYFYSCRIYPESYCKYIRQRQTTMFQRCGFNYKEEQTSPPTHKPLFLLRRFKSNNLQYIILLQQYNALSSYLYDFFITCIIIYCGEDYIQQVFINVEKAGRTNEFTSHNIAHLVVGVLRPEAAVNLQKVGNLSEKLQMLKPHVCRRHLINTSRNSLHIIIITAYLLWTKIGMSVHNLHKQRQDFCQIQNKMYENVIFTQNIEKSVLQNIVMITNIINILIVTYQNPSQIFHIFSDFSTFQV
ncbi:Hypothetical_protein [Hexamita inflata]|uniref:Hypothetical_protein n=1 Tax=Hexamita inflata TaxID=28002 RepID=A0AA86UUD6_9EUKA|nr:Hypothetical protein HINF_LOCUS37503 [Hexamita inflata]